MSAARDPKYGGDLDQVIDAWADVIAGKQPGISSGNSGSSEGGP